jgi:hypothetical protein
MQEYRDYVEEHFAKAKTVFRVGNMRVREPIILATGEKLSVQASAGHHCTPRDNFGPYTHYEVWFPDEDSPVDGVKKSTINEYIHVKGGVKQ